MKKISTRFVCLGVLYFLNFSMGDTASLAQERAPLSLGGISEFRSSFSNTDRSTKDSYALQLEKNKKVSIKLTDNNCSQNSCYVFGRIEGYENATFALRGDEKNIIGKVIFQKEKEAYDIYTSALGEVLIAPIDINKVICVGYSIQEDKNEEANIAKQSENIRTTAVPLLSSFPGALGTLYLDFDGEYVSGGWWGTINAAPSSFSNTDISRIWLSTAEDFRPFNINVTTDRTVFDAAPVTKKMMLVFTPTDNAASGFAGASYQDSWGWSTGEPGWVFTNLLLGAQQTASHEAGHTFNLWHDGGSSGAYYGGHGNWGTIMGNGYTKPILQWSNGDYASANNHEDDLAKISAKIPLRADDAGNDITTTKFLTITGNGSVVAANNSGIIETRTDRDVFKFTTTGGNVSLSIVSNNEGLTNSNVPNLDIQARLLDVIGAELLKVDPAGLLCPAVTVTSNLLAGTYYLEIDGVGAGTSSTGYSDYGSLGQYFISGIVPQNATSVQEAENNSMINIYPNPSSGIFTIIPNKKIDECTVEILNSLGQTIMVSSGFFSGNTNNEIDLSNQAAGIYCVVVKSGNDVWKGKVLLK